MKKEVFISHSSKDVEEANKICNMIEKSSIGCWIAPRDIDYGEDWAGKILNAIKTSKVFLFILSENSNKSKQCPKELNIADRNDIPIICISIDDVEMCPTLEYHLSYRQIMRKSDDLNFETALISTIKNKLIYNQDNISVTNNVKKDALNKGEIVSDDTLVSPKTNLLDFANLLTSINSTEYVEPYISSEMQEIIATSTDGMKQYTSKDFLIEGINPAIYEVFLAEKISRANDPTNCLKSFQLIHSLSNSWRVFLNDDKKVIAYWAFIALNDEAYDAINSGTFNEKDITISDVRFIDMPGRYKGHLLIAGAISELRTPIVSKAIYDSWLKYIESLAKNKIYFTEISSIVSSAFGTSSITNIGMKKYASYKYGGSIYKYDLTNIKKISFLKNTYPELTSLYEKEYENVNI